MPGNTAAGGRDTYGKLNPEERKKVYDTAIGRGASKAEAAQTVREVDTIMRQTAQRLRDYKRPTNLPTISQIHAGE